MVKATKKPDKEKSLEAVLWDSANKLRGSMEAGEYKHVVLGLIFLKYAGDRFEERRTELVAAGSEDVDDKDEYTAKSVFYLLPESRWSYVMENAKQPDIVMKVDSALAKIEAENPSLRGALPDNYYSRLNLDVSKFSALLDVINSISITGDSEQDVIGRVYEYFLGKFALSEGKKKGEYYTPKCVVKLITEMIEPYRGRIYDPCCGSGGMFVQSRKFVESHNGNSRDISVYGQEYTATTYKLAKMNLAIRGISANLGNPADSFKADQHPDLKADFIMANPPFNQKEWRGEAELVDDERWKGFGVPPTGNANYGWILHMISKLSPTGKAGFVLANGSLSTTQGGEDDIRQRIVEAGLVDCIVSLPGQLFYTTQIPVSLWFLRRSRPNEDSILFIDARNLGEMEDRTHKILTDRDIKTIADTYHNWSKGDTYADIQGFCKSAAISEVSENDFVLTPGRYVGLAEEEEDGEAFEEKMVRLTSELSKLFAEDKKAKEEICKQLASIGFEVKDE